METTPSENQPWYAEGLAFECTQCGNCCSGAPGYVWVTDEEIIGLATAMNFENDIEAFERKFVRKVGRRKSLMEYPDGDCIFLEEKTRRCLVYERRPVQCRTWPFWPSNLKMPEDWKETGKDCPGCDRGRLYNLDEIQIRRDSKAI